MAGLGMLSIIGAGISAVADIAGLASSYAAKKAQAAEQFQDEKTKNSLEAEKLQDELHSSKLEAARQLGNVRETLYNQGIVGGASMENYASTQQDIYNRKENFISNNIGFNQQKRRHIVAAYARGQDYAKAGLATGIVGAVGSGMMNAASAKLGSSGLSGSKAIETNELEE